MEELRSTEVLVQEILEDARKKAQKILKHADEIHEAQVHDLEKKAQDSIIVLRKHYEEKTKSDSNEVFARLPLDKRRIRSEFAAKCLIKAMDDFLRSLPRKTLLSVLEHELSRRIAACKEELALNGARISFAAISRTEIEELLEKVFPKGNYNFDYRPDDDPHTRDFPRITIETSSARILASVDEAAASLMKEKRAELAVALLGEGVLND